jgi:hypothetical protein
MILVSSIFIDRMRDAARSGDRDRMRRAGRLAYLIKGCESRARGWSLRDCAGSALAGASAQPAGWRAASSAHASAGDVHPEEWGTGSNNRGALNGRASLTRPIMGGFSSPRAIARRMAR